MHGAFPQLLYLACLEEQIVEEEGVFKVIMWGRKPTKEMMIGVTYDYDNL